MDNRYHTRPDFASLADTVYSAFAKRGAGVGASTDGGNDTDPVPVYDPPEPGSERQHRWSDRQRLHR